MVVELLSMPDTPWTSHVVDPWVVCFAGNDLHLADFVSA